MIPNESPNKIMLCSTFEKKSTTYLHLFRAKHSSGSLKLVMACPVHCLATETANVVGPQKFPK